MDRKPWLVLLTILGPIACLFGPVLLSDRSFSVRDAAHFYYPLFEWTASEWAAGRLPLWNPYENGGVPVVADASSSIFYPGKLVFALPLSFALKYKLYIVGHVVLAAAGVYRLARHWQSSEYAAAVAAIAYALGGNVVFQHCNIVFLIGAAWLPWSLQAADTMLVRQSWRSALALGTILALMILGGDPQAALNTLLITAVYLLFLRGATAGLQGATAGLPSSAWHTFALRSLLVGLAALSGFLLAAVQILPSSESARGSERAAYNSPRNIYEAAEFVSRNAAELQTSHQQSVAKGLFGQPDESGHHERVYDFSLAPWRVVEFVWPNVNGRMFPTNRRWTAEFIPEGRVWTPSLYMGLVPLLLAIGQLRLRRGEARSRWLSWTLLFFLIASFGFYGVGWLVNWAAREVAVIRGMEPADTWLGNPVGGLYWLMVVLLPMYVYFRYPAKLLVIVSLAISLLAARGWDAAFCEESPRMKRALRWLGTASFALAALVGVVLSFVRFAGWQSDSALGPFDFAGAKWDLLTALLQTGVVAWCALELLKRARKQSAVNWQALAVLLTAAELTLANYWLVQSAPAKLWREKPSVTGTIFASRTGPTAGSQAVLPPRVYRGRFSGWRPESFASKASPDRMTEMDRWERDTLFPKYQMPAGISLVESYGSLNSLDYQIFLDMAKLGGPLQPDQARLPHPAALRLLGSEHLLIPDNYKPGFAEPIEPEDHEKGTWPENASLWKMKDLLPRAWIVHEVVELPALAHPSDIAAVKARTLDVLLLDRRPRDFVTTAVVETDNVDATVAPPRVRSSESADALESCSIKLYEPQHVLIEATLMRPGVVIFSDAYAPGWTATAETVGNSVNGKINLPILRANRVMRGVHLPAGKHLVEFRYRPQSFYRGAVISVLSWTLLLAVTAVYGWPRMKSA